MNPVPTLPLTSLLAVLLLTPTAFAAEGDPCTADAECGAGFSCDLPPQMGGGSGVGGSTGTDIPVQAGASAELLPPPSGGSAGALAEPVPVVGECAVAPLPCTSDADCGERYECVFDQDSASVACDSSGGCPDPVETTSTEGTCQGVPMACAVDADCPEASTCLDAVCTFTVTACASDTECPASYQCLESVVETCSVGPCMAGEECTAEPVCTIESSEGYCFPAPVPCATEAECSGGWGCYDVPNADAPEPWLDVDKGCLPGGIVGAIEGYVAVDGETGLVSNESGDGGLAGDPRGDEAAATAGDSGESGGCSVTSPRSSASGAFSLLLAALGLAAARRRRFR